MSIKSVLKTILLSILSSDNKPEPYGTFDPKYTVYSGQKNRTITFVVGSKDVCFECGEKASKHPLNMCKNFRPTPPPTDTGR